MMRECVETPGRPGYYATMKVKRVAIQRGLGWFVLLLALLTWPQAASAHATVVRAEPRFDEVVPQAPTEVHIQFSEPVKLGADALTVIAPSGRRVDRRDARVDQRDPALVRVNVQAGETGTYRVVWRVLSADAHVVAGSYTFSVGSPSKPPPETPLASVSTWYWQALARWVHLVALCLAGGPLVVRLLLGRRVDFTEAERLLWSLARRGALLGFAGTILFLLVQALGLGGSLGSVLDPAVLRSTLGGSLGLLSATRLLLFWMLYLGCSYLHLRDTRTRSLPLVGVLILLALTLITSLTGHPATTPPVPLSVAVDAIHLLATVIWLGGLLALVPLLARAQHAAASSAVSSLLRQVLPRYAIAAMACFDVLLLTGAYQLWVNLERPAQLLDTGYGKALLVKGALIAGLVTLGAASAWTLRGVWRSPEPGRPEITRGRRFVALEAAIAILLLASVGILTALPPAKSLRQAAESAAASPGVTLARNAGPFLATLTLAPAEPGANQVAVLLQDPGGRPVEDAEVSVLVQPLGKVGPAPSRIRLERASDAFHGQVALPTSDRWSIEVLVKHPALAEEQRAAFEIAVPVPGARLILERADTAMNRLQSLVEYNELTSGGPVVRTTAEYRAPDRLRYVIETPGRQPTTTIAVHNRRYDRVGDGPWTVSPWRGTEPFRWPNYRFAEGVRDVLLLGTESIDGVDCYVVSFFDPRSGARYRMWIGTSDYLIRRYEMMAIGHYMVVRFHSFNDPSIQIDAPVAAGAP